MTSVGALGDAGRRGERVGGHVPHVEALDRDDAAVGGDRMRELAVPDIHGDHRTAPRSRSTWREPAGRRAHVERDAPGDVDRERVEGGDQLVRARLT